MNTQEKDPLEDSEMSGHGYSLPEKSHDDSEAIWLLSYSDMMTLLMGFFALMLSMSSLDSAKMSELQQEAKKKFGGDYEKPLQDLQQELQTLINQNQLQDQVSVEAIPTGVVLVFKGTILFDSGSIVLNESATNIFNKFIPIIKSKALDKYYYYFEGHTDNDPINKNIIASNWELSGLRASSIARKFEANGFDKYKMTVIGWGDTKPLLPNVDDSGRELPENKAKNRRITIKISSEADSL